MCGRNGRNLVSVSCEFTSISFNIINFTVSSQKCVLQIMSKKLRKLLTLNIINFVESTVNLCALLIKHFSRAQITSLKTHQLIQSRAIFTLKKFASAKINTSAGKGVNSN
jgi:hypothetical protein